MNYQLHYDKLINRARNRKLEGYIEKHHIKPRCMGGDSSIWNIVSLTAEEHFIAHLLLVKIYPNHIGLITAVTLMITCGKRQNCKIM